ncbi:MAG: hypothetical protein ACREGI_04830 [Candidatus Levyibacteriota bacterium]
MRSKLPGIFFAVVFTFVIGASQTFALEQGLGSQPPPPRGNPNASTSAAQPENEKGGPPSRTGPFTGMQTDKNEGPGKDFRPPTGYVSARALIEKKLAGTKLQACQKVGTKIADRSKDALSKTRKYKDTVTSVRDGINNFYESVLVPKSLTIATYSALLDDTNTKETTLNNAIAQAQSDIANFTCDGTNPTDQLKNFKTDMDAVLTALKAYAQSVRTLGQAVKQEAASLPRDTKTNVSSESSRPKPPDANDQGGGQ